MTKLVTDINFFPNETLIRLEDGDILSSPAVDEKGNRKTLQEFEELFFIIQHAEIYVTDCEDEVDE